jgi:hypothetical protein
MSAYMVVGMGLWMRHRRHDWASVLEMSGAMIVPYTVLVGPFAAGLLAKGTFLSAMHVLMLPCMYVAMVHRRGHYEQDHSRHRGGTHHGRASESHHAATASMFGNREGPQTRVSLRP